MERKKKRNEVRKQKQEKLSLQFSIFIERQLLLSSPRAVLFEGAFRTPLLVTGCCTPGCFQSQIIRTPMSYHASVPPRASRMPLSSTATRTNIGEHSASAAASSSKSWGFLYAGPDNDRDAAGKGGDAR